MMEGFFLGGFIALFIGLFALAIFLFVFWILMIVDCAKRKFKKENDQIIWILVLVFLQALGAIIYYFVVKRED